MTLLLLRSILWSLILPQPHIVSYFGICSMVSNRTFYFIFFEFYFIFYTAGSYYLSILYILVYICQSQSPNSSHHHSPHRQFPPLVSICLFSTSVSQFLPCKPVQLYHFSRFHIYALIYAISFSLSDLLHSV